MIDKARKARMSAYLGKKVHIVIDRPAGSVHPGQPELRYPLNYGYIPGTDGGDGEGQDVYLLGVDEPVAEYDAVIIGIIYRNDDNEDKLVAAPEGKRFDQAEIADAVDFQERYFDITLDCALQRSCGAIIYREIDASIEFLLLFQKRSKTWSFPKGHIERGETETETALREIKEETGLEPELIPDFRKTVEYSVAPNIRKEVVLYLAALNGQPEQREAEITEFRWVTPDEAIRLLYPGYAQLIASALARIRGTGYAA